MGMFDFFKKIIAGSPEGRDGDQHTQQARKSHDTSGQKKSPESTTRPWGEKKDQKKPEWWTEVVGADTITHFPGTEDLARPTSREALRGSLLTMLGVQEPGHLQSQKDFVAAIHRWSEGATDMDISRFERLVHRVNAMHGIHGGEAVQQIVLPVIEDTLFHIKRAEYARPSFRFRGRVLEFLKTGEVLDGTREPSVAGRDSYHKAFAHWLQKADEHGIRKVELFLLKAREVMKKNGNAATVEDVIEDSLTLINAYRIQAGLQQPVRADQPHPSPEKTDVQPQESAEQTEHILGRYRGTILAGVGLVPAGTPVDREPFDTQLHSWLRADTTVKEDIDHLTKFVQKITTAASQQKITKDIRDFIDHVNTMLIEGVRDRIARHSAVQTVVSPASPSPELAIPPVGMPTTHVSEPPIQPHVKALDTTAPQEPLLITERSPITFQALDEHDIATDDPAVFRAKILDALGASDGQEAVGQKYFENRLREWLERAVKDPQGDALRTAATDLIKRTEKIIESAKKMRKKSEKSNSLTSADDIINPKDP